MVNDKRRGRILDACAALLMKYGYDKMTVSDVAAEAHISKGAIYLHFPSKEAMVEALVWREVDEAQHDIMARIADDPHAGSFLSLFRHSLHVALARPLLRAFFANRKTVYGDMLRILAPKFANAHGRQLSTEFVRQYQSLGLIRADLDPAAVAFVLACIRYGFMVIDEIIPSDEMPPLEDSLVALMELLAHGLGMPEGEGNLAAGREAFSQLIHDAVEQGKTGQADGEGDDA